MFHCFQVLNGMSVTENFAYDGDCLFICMQMFKLEDVAMGIWIAEMKKGGLKASYIKEERVYNEGCRDGFVVAHYQSPHEMLCLWQKLQQEHQAKCCVNR